MRKELYDIVSNFKIVQWQGCPTPTNEEVYMQLTDYLLGNRVIVTPVKPGDYVYTINRGRVKEWKVYFVGLNHLGEFTFNIADEGFHNSRGVWDREIGETVFLTEAAVEQEIIARKLRRVKNELQGTEKLGQITPTREAGDSEA